MEAMGNTSSLLPLTYPSKQSETIFLLSSSREAPNKWFIGIFYILSTLIFIYLFYLLVAIA